jgi:hypothetical protein
VNKEPLNRKGQIDDGVLDRATDPEYAAISLMAIMGLVLSMAGLAAFFVPPMIMIPLLGFLVSLAAWRRIRRSQGVLAGQSLARAGMVLGAAMTLTSAALHLELYREERQVYNLVADEARDAVQAIRERNFGKVYTSMPDDFRARQATSVQAFGEGFDAWLKDAGDFKEQNLLSLTPVMTKEKILIQKVIIRTDFQKRSLEFQLWYMPDTTRRWKLIGVACGETFDSQVKNQGKTAPPPVESPVREKHDHDHGD